MHAWHACTMHVCCEPCQKRRQRHWVWSQLSIADFTCICVTLLFQYKGMNATMSHALISSLSHPLGWTGLAKCSSSNDTVVRKRRRSQFMRKYCKLGMKPQKVTKLKILKKNMSPQKSARITGPPKKALDFSKSVRLNMCTLFFARKEVQVCYVFFDMQLIVWDSIHGPPHWMKMESVVVVCFSTNIILCEGAIPWTVARKAGGSPNLTHI